MNELKTLEERLKSATDRISAAVTMRDDTHDTSHENTELKDELRRLKAQREQDMAQLDELLSQLRPLMEAENA